MKNKLRFKNHILVKNKKLYHNFFIKKTIQAGIVLKGWEVKNIRSKKADLIGSYIRISYKEAFLCNFSVNNKSSDINRFNNNKDSFFLNKKLLLKKNEILNLSNILKKNGYTVVPIEFYLKNQWIKLKIGIAIGKKKTDKRNIEKKRDWKIEKNRITKRNMN
ncbi:SsrA-binding protein [Buchnera aphidicola (Tetraneura ulmi)]|uniref:SsrA-binding protein SmpB n=1 Tax=Buchnera aphidicola TaxID=9 RepID=UPI003464C529